MGLPREIEKQLEEGDRERAVCYTSMDDLADRLFEAAREIESEDEDDGVVIDPADSSDSIVVRVREVADHIADDTHDD